MAFAIPDFFLVVIMSGLAYSFKKLIEKFSSIVVIRGKTIPSKVYEATDYLVLQGLLTGAYGLFLLILIILLLASFFYDLL